MNIIYLETWQCEVKMEKKRQRTQTEGNIDARKKSGAVLLLLTSLQELGNLSFTKGNY